MEVIMGLIPNAFFLWKAAGMER